MNNEIFVKIGEKTYKIKKTFKALLLFENESKKKITEINESLGDLLLLFYCIIKSNNVDFLYSYDDFINLIDDNPDAIEVFNDYLNNEAQQTKKNTTKKKVIK